MLSFTLLSYLSILAPVINAIPITLTSIKLSIYNTQQANATWYYGKPEQSKSDVADRGVLRERMLFTISEPKLISLTLS